MRVQDLTLHGEEGTYYTTEAPGIAPRGFLKKKTAATYSPTGVQYHRRGRA